MTRENHFASPLQGFPLVPTARRSEAAWSGSGLMQPCRGDGHQPDVWPSPAGIPLATCLWPSARRVRPFLAPIFFSPQKGLLRLRGFLQGKPAAGWKPCQCPKASKEKRQIRKQSNNIVREKNVKRANNSQSSQGTHGNCFTPSEQHLLMQTALLISMRSLL